MTDKAKRAEADTLLEPIALEPEQLREIASATAGAGLAVVAGLGPLRQGGLLPTPLSGGVAVE